MAWVLYNGHDADQTQLQELDSRPTGWTVVPDPVLASVSYKGKVYGVPLNIHRVNTFFYNKDVFDRVGLHIEDLKTLDDVFGAAEMIKAYNQQQLQANPDALPITPIAMGFRQTQGDMATDDTWTLALLFFENILVAHLGGRRLLRSCSPSRSRTTRTWRS